MKRFVIILFALGALVGAGMASAQRGGGSGGGSHGGGGSAGGMHGGGSWSGGSHGGSWNGGHGGWNGGHGGWNGGHGGSWNGGWHGGWHGGTNVVVGFGGPWWGWWPGYYPYYGYAGYGYPAAYPYTYPNYGYGEYYPAPTYDTGTYVERPDAGYQGGQPQQYQGGQVTSDGYVYYCPNPAGYYPQVPTCAAGWLRVVPQGGGPTAPSQR